jgi:uncharacterized delta-60 repeat protein
VRKALPIFLATAAGLLAFAVSAQADIREQARFDPSFADHGVFRAEYPTELGGVSGVIEDRRGRLTTTGTVNSDEVCSHSLVTRFLPSGKLDSAFGKDGLLKGRRNCQYGARIANYPGGGFVQLVTETGGINGYRFEGTEAYLYDATGNLSHKWGTSKYPGEAESGYLEPEGMAIDGRGRTLVSGYVWRQVHGSIAKLVRLGPDGRLDRSLIGGKGTRTESPGVIEIRAPEGVDATFTDVRTLGSGKILLSGKRGSRVIVVRLNNDGSFDRTFGKRGIFSMDFGRPAKCNCADEVAMVRDYHGRILVGAIAGPGAFRNDSGGYKLRLIRLGPDGRLDRGFASRGFADQSARNPINFRSLSVAVQDDGRILLAGEGRLSRFLSTGRRDNSFFGGHLGYRKAGWIYNVIIDHRGRIVTAGSSIYGDLQLNRILP